MHTKLIHGLSFAVAALLLGALVVCIVRDIARDTRRFLMQRAWRRRRGVMLSRCPIPAQPQHARQPGTVQRLPARR